MTAIEKPVSGRLIQKHHLQPIFWQNTPCVRQTWSRKQDRAAYTEQGSNSVGDGSAYSQDALVLWVYMSNSSHPPIRYAYSPSLSPSSSQRLRR